MNIINRILFVIAVFSFGLFNIALAETMPLNPSCRISAKVESITGPRTSSGGVIFYYVQLDVSKISTTRAGSSASCDDLLASINAIENIMTGAEYEKQPIAKGDKIDANIIVSGDQSLPGYFLKDVIITQDVNINKNSDSNVDWGDLNEIPGSDYAPEYFAMVEKRAPWTLAIYVTLFFLAPLGGLSLITGIIMWKLSKDNEVRRKRAKHILWFSVIVIILIIPIIELISYLTNRML